jgi:hypothetical protein
MIAAENSISASASEKKIPVIEETEESHPNTSDFS